MQKIKLGDVCKYAEDRIAVSTLTKKNYISTENLLPNKGGITIAATLPKISTTPAFQVGDILISNIRQYFKKIWYANFNGGCSNDVLVLRTNKDFDSKFLYYVLSEDKFFDFATATSKGTKMPRGDKQILMTYPMPNFPLETQKKIGAFLYSLDEKISLNKKINATLEAMAKTLYDYWFVQFDFPDENGKPYKSSGGKMIFNAELGREIPEGWQVKTLDFLIKSSKNGDWGKAEPDEKHTHKVICLRGADFPAINGYETLNAPVRYISEKNIDRILDDGDIIIEISGGSPTQSTGRACYINSGTIKRFETDITTSNFCKSLTMNAKENMYYFYLMWTDLYNNGILFNFEGKTTGIKNLLFDVALKSIKTALPKQSLLKKFNNQVANFFQMIQKNNQENQSLANLRDFLLPLLMNGQVGLKEE